MPSYRVRQAAQLLGVSDDTLRRWAESGRIETTKDQAGRSVVDGAALARLAEEVAAGTPDAAGVEVVQAFEDYQAGRLGVPAQHAHSGVDVSSDDD